MQELHRVAKHDAEFHIRVPHGATEVAFEDPTHVRHFFPQSFMYFGQPFYHLADYGYRGDWKVEHIHLTLLPRCSLQVNTTEGEDRLNFMRWLAGEWNKVHEIYALLRAVKPIRKVNAPHDKPKIGISVFKPTNDLES
jgi:hypothetical protein